MGEKGFEIREGEERMVLTHCKVFEYNKNKGTYPGGDEINTCLPCFIRERYQCRLLLRLKL